MFRVATFFYGLFMDEDLLRAEGLAPAGRRVVTAADHALEIGGRAVLVPRPGAAAWGVVFDLTHDEIDRLYRTPSTADYREAAVIATPVDRRDAFPALTYTLDPAAADGPPNLAYAGKLAALMRRLGAPDRFLP